MFFVTRSSSFVVLVSSSTKPFEIILITPPLSGGGNNYHGIILGFNSGTKRISCQDINPKSDEIIVDKHNLLKCKTLEG